MLVGSSLCEDLESLWLIGWWRKFGVWYARLRLTGVWVLLLTSFCYACCCVPFVDVVILWNLDSSIYIHKSLRGFNSRCGVGNDTLISSS